VAYELSIGIEIGGLGALMAVIPPLTLLERKHRFSIDIRS